MNFWVIFGLLVLGALIGFAAHAILFGSKTIKINRWEVDTWAVEARERVQIHSDWGEVTDVMVEMLEDYEVQVIK